MSKVRIGIVGIGNMGTAHADNLLKGHVRDAELVAICDKNESRLKYIEDTYDQELRYYKSFDEMIEDKNIDGIIIATPHYDHPIMGEMALKAGYHVLVEKPIGVYTKAVESLIETASKTDKVFTIMYNQRTNPVYQKAKEMIESGQLGEMYRVSWYITDWFRSAFYYNSGGWRATWKGEGGGVLLNQCPHQIDLIQWLCGMPKRVKAIVSEGRYHDIEVEDDVTAFFEYDNGATGVFVTSTGESPGTNRLEISGEFGKVQIVDNTLTFYENKVSALEHLNTSKDGFEKPEMTKSVIEVEGKETGHVGIMQDFTDGILTGKKQLAPGAEGINGLSLSNAIHLAGWTQEWVDLPIDSEKFYKALQDKIDNSTVVKADVCVQLNLENSH